MLGLECTPSCKCGGPPFPTFHSLMETSQGVAGYEWELEGAVAERRFMTEHHDREPLKRAGNQLAMYLLIRLEIGRLGKRLEGASRVIALGKWSDDGFTSQALSIHGGRGK
jgi:hypothetical protein